MLLDDLYSESLAIAGTLLSDIDEDFNGHIMIINLKTLVLGIFHYIEL